ncbi:MAG: ATP-binding protein [Pseudomonadota bacterium]
MLEGTHDRVQHADARLQTRELTVDVTDQADSEWIERMRRRIVASRFLLLACSLVFVVMAANSLFTWTTAFMLVAAMIWIAAITPAQTARARKRTLMEPRPSHDYSITNGILNALREPLVILDGRGTITFVTDTARVIVGDLVIGSAAVLRFRAPELQSIIQKAMAGASPDPIELRERGQQDRFFEVSAFRLPEQVGPQYRVCLFFKDATQAYSTERMRSNFVANASHELRTPLASLTGYIETLAGPAKDDPAAREQFLPIMMEQTTRMSRLVNDLLHLSRYETARGVEDFTPIDVSDVLLHVTDAVRPLSEGQGSRLTLNVAEELKPVKVNGSREELIQLFENLVENAIKYGGPESPVEIEVSETTLDTARAWQINVTDHGQGIEAEHLPRLTERFYRVDAEVSRGKQGTGLGLAIAKHVVTRHKGRMTIESEVGEGTTFSVSLPKI